jgi:hypothetical protein
MEEERRVSGAILPTMTALFIACFIGIPLGVVAATDSEGVIYATLGVLAVVFVVGMWLVARRFRPAAAQDALVRVRRIERELSVHGRR